MILVDRINLFSLSFLIIPCFLFFNSCSNDKITIYGSTMGTSYTIKINSSKYKQYNYLENLINHKLKELNSIFSTYDYNSEISKINFSTSNNFIISNELKYVLDKSIYYSYLSDGLYDPTVYPLVDLWGFGPTRRDSIPSINDINLVLSNISYTNLSISGNNFVKLNKNSFIDLSSIAKGYAVDQITNLLLNEGYKNFMIEIGGEVRCVGSNDSNNWVIGIINPFLDRELVKVGLSDLSVATSGNYNNYTTYNGIEYSHIINPKTGFPIKNNIVSASVISKKCIDSDAIATILMMLPYDEGIELVNKLDKVECVIFIDDGKDKMIIKSNNFDDYVY